MNDIVARLLQPLPEFACDFPCYTKQANAERAEAANRIEELEAALRYLVSECDEDMDDDYNPHYAPLAQARAALLRGESK